MAFNTMEEYYKLTWPESQKYMDEKYEGLVYSTTPYGDFKDSIVIFVPKELYDAENNR